MAKLKNSQTKRDLSKNSVYITDTDPLSTYFKLSELPDVLTSGKNAFLINGSVHLKETTEVLVEITDANGNAIFSRPIRDYSEGLARVVSIEVYDNTPRGTAVMTILGELKSDKNGNPIPPEWRGKYNVKFTKTFIVEPTLPNSTKVRLYKRPQLEVSEFLIPYREVKSTGVSAVESGSLISGKANRGIFGSDVGLRSTDYIIGISSGSLKFIKNMEGGSVTASFGDTTYSSSILSVVSENYIVADEPYIDEFGNIGSFDTTNFRIEYNSGSSYILTLQNRSFAGVELTNLTTFSGDIARTKIYVKSVDGAGEYEPIADLFLEQNEITVTQSLQTGEPSIRLGYFADQEFSDVYWVADPITSSSYSN
jgi:hypothetical protein